MVKSQEGASAIATATANYGGTDSDALGEKLRLERVSSGSANANGEYRPQGGLGLAGALASNNHNAANYEAPADSARAPPPYRNGNGAANPAASNPFAASSAFR